MDAFVSLTSSAIRQRFAALAATGLAILMLGTSNVTAAESKVPTVTIEKNKIKLEVASSDAQIKRGLMYRTHMPEDQGMVFLFHPARPVKFWMAHCFISLDMLMIKEGKIVKIFENVPPERDKPEDACPTYPPKGEPAVVVSEVVEVNGGYAKRHSIKEGDPVNFSFAVSSVRGTAGAGK